MVYMLLHHFRFSIQPKEFRKCGQWSPLRFVHANSVHTKRCTFLVALSETPNLPLLYAWEVATQPMAQEPG